MQTVLTNARLILENEIVTGTIAFENGVITAVELPLARGDVPHEPGAWLCGEDPIPDGARGVHWVEQEAGEECPLPHREQAAAWRGSAGEAASTVRPSATTSSSTLASTSASTSASASASTSAASSASTALCCSSARACAACFAASAARAFASAAN